MNIGIHGINLDDRKKNVLSDLVKVIKKYKINIFYSKRLSKQLSFKNIKTYNKKNINELEFIISFGGDGTLLDTVTHVENSGKHILGINIGKLGFLSNDVYKKFEILLKEIINKKYTIDKRSLVRLNTISRNIKKNYALNEISIIKKDSSSMIKIHCHINNQFLCTYWSDGLIISTPTGSTGYSLSCGGPILTPNTNNLIITPISPHNLGLRSLVVSNNSKIKLVVESEGFDFLISMDSRSFTCKNEEELIITKADFDINLIQPNNFDFFETLRNKLNWGYDFRN
jgi:NAD+ kinase|tara:strand:+ start:868 stop:1722 length:855 start_codon:yes stop_codon:yes gene_type:complete